jgi:hypothetical protein
MHFEGVHIHKSLYGEAAVNGAVIAKSAFFIAGFYLGFACWI